MNQDKENAWAEVKEFRDKEGRNITQFSVLEGEKKGKNFYKGQVALLIKPPDQNQSPQNVPFEFDFPEDKDFEWVKENFDEIANEAIENWKEEQQKKQEEQKNKIVSPKDSPNIIKPDFRHKG